MESLQKQIVRTKNFLGVKSPYYAGQDTFTITRPGAIAAEVGSYVIPYIGLRRGLLQGLKGFPELAKKYEALSPVNKVAIDAVSFGLSDFIVADPTDLHTFGDYLGGPTAIKPDDSVMEKKAKVFAESVVFGGSISGATHGLGNLFRGSKPPKFNTEPKSLTKGQKATDPNDGVEYTWLGAQWVTDTGRVAAKKVGERLTFFTLNPRADWAGAQSAVEAVDLTPGTRVTARFPELPYGSVRSLGPKKYEWKGPETVKLYEDMSLEEIRAYGVARAPELLEEAAQTTRLPARWVEQKNWNSS